MKNGAKPINPILDLNQDLTGMWGLTKREYFAGLAMQGILASSDKAAGGYECKERLCRVSIQTADELLKQLEL